MAAAARVLRGGRRSGSCSHHLPLMPGIGRRAPLERAAGPLLPRLGAAGDAGGMGRRAMSQESFKKKLTVIKHDYVQIDGTFKPINSSDVLMDLQERVYKMGYEARLFKERRSALPVLAVLASLISLSAWRVHSQHEENKKAMSDLKVCATQMECSLKNLKAALHKDK